MTRLTHHLGGTGTWVPGQACREQPRGCAGAARQVREAGPASKHCTSCPPPHTHTHLSEQPCAELVGQQELRGTQQRWSFHLLRLLLRRRLRRWLLLLRLLLLLLRLALQQLLLLALLLVHHLQKLVGHLGGRPFVDGCHHVGGRARAAAHAHGFLDLRRTAHGAGVGWGWHMSGAAAKAGR